MRDYEVGAIGPDGLREPPPKGDPLRKFAPKFCYRPVGAYWPRIIWPGASMLEAERQFLRVRARQEQIVAMRTGC